MRYEDLEKLLGGYAHGTLSESERKALFAAALDHQELFDQLAGEEALRDLLGDPRCRRQLLALLGTGREPAWRRALAWIGRPRALALAGGLAAVVAVTSIVVQVQRREPAAAPETQVARSRPMPLQAEPAGPPAAEKKAAPAPAAPPRRDQAPARRFEMPESRTAAPALTAPPAPAETREQASADIAAPAAPKAAGPPTVMAEQAAPPADARALYDRPLRAEPLGFASGAVRAKAARAQMAFPLGLRYTIVRNGIEASPADNFRTGERLELAIETNQGGLVLVLRQNSAGSWTSVRTVPTETGKRVAIPLPVRREPGEEKLLIVFSHEATAEQESNRRNLQKAEDKAVYTVDPDPGPGAVVRAELRLIYR